ncbi:bifunctional sugar-1-phosphate nucleotidylyltransferase/acetyltransferase [Geoglobus acetivorans]|uniref:Bifunctional protein GlmU n=1 Tax=Geoglobus acetivorans TaxID=565033 RepID=A0A0A7GE62_GEOAI|nr:Glucosamine-1-phosphate N-acetyltransferase [Geoglobus acetivorans]
MQAVILAAGEGTRMRPLTYTKPKVMLPVANKPILQHVVENLIGAGVDEVILVVGYREERVREHLGEEFSGVRIRYVRQRKQLGTAHALLSAEHLLEDRFVMLNGDAIVFEDDLKNLLREEMAIAVREVENPQDFGVVTVEDGVVREIIEKPEVPKSNLINAGIYVFKKEIVDYLRRTPLSVRGEYEITDSITMAVQDGVEFKAVRIERWIDVGYPWDMLRANEILLSEIERDIRGEVEEGAVIKGNVVIGEGSVVMAGSYIVGPVIIGRNCRIGPNCYIRPYTSIGDNCHVGNAVEIKNSIIMSNTKIPHLNYIGDSVIGENCNFGAGTKIANLRLDEGEITVNVKGKPVNTGRKKFGAAVGDNVKTGINASINVGSLIGNDVFIGPGAVAAGFIQPHSRVF